MNKIQFISELENFKKLLLTNNSNVIGCSEEQLVQLEIFYNIKLPEFYRLYLSFFGIKSGSLLLGTEAFYESLIGDDNITSAFIELLNENNKVAPEFLFAIELHQGYSGAFFISFPYNDDPVIYSYTEGEDIVNRGLFSNYTIMGFKEHVSYWEKGVIEQL